MLNNTLLSLASYKNSEDAIILGSGSSINGITEKQWKVISRYDTFAINNWVYHPFFVPKYYMIETKWYAYEIMKRRFQEKSKQYKSTVFMFPQGKHIRMKDGRSLPLKQVIPNGHINYEVPLQKRGNRESPDKYNAEYKFSSFAIHKSYDMSMTSLIEIIYRLGYTNLILFGVDLYNSLYFWSSGDAKYGEVHHLWNKQHENRQPQAPHNTSRITQFIIDFNNRYFIPSNGEIFVGTKNTSLYPSLNYELL